MIDELVRYFSSPSYREVLLSSLGQHVYLSLVPLLLGVLVAVPLGRFAQRAPRARAALLGSANVVYTVPSLALFVIIPAVVGTGATDSINVVIALTIYNAALLVRPVMPAELTPPYWVFMGLAAITVLAGALLPANPLVGRVTEVSAVLWAFCAWLVPMLLALGVWRHVLRGVPLRFRTDLWAMVFPIGMYGLASIRLGTATGTRWMTAFGSAVGWVAFAVWLVVFAAMVAKRLSTNAVAQRSPR